MVESSTQHCSCESTEAFKGALQLTHEITEDYLEGGKSYRTLQTDQSQAYYLKNCPLKEIPCRSRWFYYGTLWKNDYQAAGYCHCLISYCILIIVPFHHSYPPGGGEKNLDTSLRTYVSYACRDVRSHVVVRGTVFAIWPSM